MRTRFQALFAVVPLLLFGALPAAAADDYQLMCLGGGAMSVASGTGVMKMVFFIQFAPGGSPGQLQPGQCAWADRAVNSAEPHVLTASIGLPHLKDIVDVVRGGGRFTVRAVNIGNGLKVNSVENFHVETASNPSVPPAGSGYVLSCQGGGGMTPTSGSGAMKMMIFVPFAAAAQGSNAAPPEPGECAWADRRVSGAEPKMLVIPIGTKNLKLLTEAAAGGTFQVHANNTGTALLVNMIDSVQVMDSTPISTGPVMTDPGDDTPTDLEPPVSDDAVLEPPIDEDTKIVTIKKAVNVHVTAGKSTPVLGSLSAGKSVTLLGCSKGWCHVQFTGGDGWVGQDFLDLSAVE